MADDDRDALGIGLGDDLTHAIKNSTNGFPSRQCGFNVVEVRQCVVRFGVVPPLQPAVTLLSQARIEDEFTASYLPDHTCCLHCTIQFAGKDQVRSECTAVRRDGLGRYPRLVEARGRDHRVRK